MKNILIFIVFLGALYQGFEYHKANNLPPLYNHPYLVVYGKDTCGFTQQTIKELTKSGVKFEYMNLDVAEVKLSLQSRMEAKGIDTNHYSLPVIDLNNSIEFRPDDEELISNAKKLSL